MKRKVWAKEELSEVFRISENGELERLFRGLDWRTVDCKCNHNEGYCAVRLRGSNINYHTIVWILINGFIEDENAVIDHIDGNKLNNKIENLRLVTNRENCQNRTTHRAGRLTGCFLDKRWNKWQARIRINSKRISLGYYNTELEAHTIYCIACELMEQYIDIKQFRELLEKQHPTKGIILTTDFNEYVPKNTP